MSWLKVEKLRFAVAGKTLLAPLDFELEPGQSLGIVGPNGAGKSTLLRLLSGYLKASAGSVWLEQQAIQDLPAMQRARLLAVVNPREELPPFAMLTLEYLKLGRAPWQNWLGNWSDQDQKALRLAIERTGVSHLLSEGLQELSSGEWQRVQLARALTQTPRLLLLDEPTSHLDIAAQIQVMHLLSQLKSEGMGMICVIHDLNLAAQYMDRLLLLQQGRLLVAGSPHQVLNRTHLETAYGLKLNIQNHPRTELPMLIPDYDPE